MSMIFLTYFYEGLGTTGSVVEIMWHRWIIRWQTEKTKINLNIGKNRSTRLNRSLYFNSSTWVNRGTLLPINLRYTGKEIRGQQKWKKVICSLNMFFWQRQRRLSFSYWWHCLWQPRCARHGGFRQQTIAAHRFQSMLRVHICFGNKLTVNSSNWLRERRDHVQCPAESVP